jgi:hypothetical protein
MGNCSSTSNCNPCGPDFSAINQLATKAGAYARQANRYSIDAANSAINAENAFLEFNALYLGAFDVAPTTDNEGDPLQVGALYWNSVSSEMFVWDGTIWLPDAFNEFTPFTATGTTFARNLVTRESDLVNVKDFGAVGDGVTDDTAAIQSAIDAVYAVGGGTVYFPSGEYLVSASSLVETYDNDGIAVPASSGAIIVRKGVSLAGPSGRSAHIHTNNNTITVLFMVAPENNAIENLEISAEWDAGEAGAGHGIFTLGTAAGADRACNNNLWNNLYIHNVASYALGLQNGSPTGCSIQNILAFNTGADALDLKARGANPLESSGNFCSNVFIKNHGQRVTGSAGIDVRGIWHLSGISVIDFGGNASLSYVGIRFRTISAAIGDVVGAGRRSSLTGAYVRPTIGALASGLTGYSSGSWDVHASNVVVEGCDDGFVLGGNINGVPLRNTLEACTSLDSSNYGFFVAADVEDARLIACSSFSSGVAGYRNEGVRTIIVGCRSTSDAAQKSTSVTANQTEITLASGLGSEMGATESSQASGRAGFSLAGSSADIDFVIAPKGNGVVRSGTHAAITTETLSGFITVKDSAGNTRKLAVVS